jgi:acyl carrier protein
VPVHTVCLLPPKAIPKTSSGKLQRRACRNSFGAGEFQTFAISALQGDVMPRPEYVAPRTELERRLAAIWKHTLAMDRVGIEDDFFQIGGHSVLASQMLAQISDEMEVELPIRQLFETPTIKKLAEVITSSGAAAGRNGTGIHQIKKLVRQAAVSDE